MHTHYCPAAAPSPPGEREAECTRVCSARATFRVFVCNIWELQLVPFSRSRPQGGRKGRPFFYAREGGTGGGTFGDGFCALTSNRGAA